MQPRVAYLRVLNLVARVAVDANRPLFVAGFPCHAVGTFVGPGIQQDRMTFAAHLGRILVGHRRPAIVDLDDAVAVVAVVAARGPGKTGQEQCPAVFAVDETLDQSGWFVVAGATVLDLVNR